MTAPTSAGGAERVVESLAIGHHRRGHEVIVAPLLSAATEHHPFVEMLQTNGVRVHPLRLRARDYLGERRAIRELCQAVTPDVVHLHGYRMELNNRGVVARLGLPTVTTIHGASKMGGRKGAVLEWLQIRNYRRFDAVVAVSSPLKELATSSGVSSDRVHLIPNAWSGLRRPMSPSAARAQLGLADSERVIGWVGRLIHVKGGDIFLEAMSQLPEPRPTAIMIGYGPEADALRARVEGLGLADTVRLVDGIRDAARFFSAFDTFVVSSRSEGLPIVILEAMASRTPIVATRVGGIPDALRNGEALLVPPEDPSALAGAMAESLRDRVGSEQRAELAAARLRNDYSLGTFLDRYEDVYHGVLRSCRDRAPSP